MEKSSKDVAPESSSADMVTSPAASEDAAIWQARATYLQSQAQRSEDSRAALEQQVFTIGAQLRALEAHAAALQSRLAQAESLLDAARSAAPGTPRLAGSTARPHITNLVDTLPRSADPGNQYAQRPLANIRRLVIHHSGSSEPAQTAQQMAEFHVKDLKHQWPGIGFHFFIDAAGTIYQTNRLETACFHVLNNNAETVGIAIAGDFSGRSPSAAQVASTAALLAWLLQELHLPLQSIMGHSEFADQGAECPGAGWATRGGWKEPLLAQVRQQMQMPRRSLYHYVLFWQTDAAWAESDWQAAAHYIARFRPTAGFSAEEARQAENVTIIGGPAGVSVQVEEMLSAAGCRVQRIAGKNAKQTRALLDAMAKDGHRFIVV